MKNKEKKCKCKKEKKTKESKHTITEELRLKADLSNEMSCSEALEELFSAADEGEYVKTIDLKINQIHYLKALGLKVNKIENSASSYEISWQYEDVV